MQRLFTILLAMVLVTGCSRNIESSASVESSEKPNSSSQPMSESLSVPVEPSSSVESSTVPTSAPAPTPAPSQSSGKPDSSSMPTPTLDWSLELVNSANPLRADFKVELASIPQGYEVDSRIVEPWNQMYAAAASEGVTLLPCYGYRTTAQSQQLFDKQIARQKSFGLSQEDAVKEAKKWVAPPGFSDHHTGLAMDIVTPENQVLSAAFATTPAAIWMAANGYKYGFVIRYPQDKQEITGITYEPWHLRYVGTENAKAMFDNNLCLEEYLKELQQ